MRQLLLLVASATLAALSTAQSPGNSTAVDLITPTLTQVETKLSDDPDKMKPRMGPITCDGSYFSCLSSLRMSLRKLGMYIDCTDCCRCRINRILIEIKLILQVHFPDSTPYICDNCIIGCQTISCLIDDIRRILINILGVCDVCVIESCTSELCRLRQIIVLLRRVVIVITEIPRDNCWSCLIQRCGDYARRRRTWGDESSLQILFGLSYNTSSFGSLGFRSKAPKVKPVVSNSCTECLKTHNCETCTTLFSCKCEGSGSASKPASRRLH